MSKMPRNEAEHVPELRKAPEIEPPIILWARCPVCRGVYPWVLGTCPKCEGVLMLAIYIGDYVPARLRP